MSYEFDKLLEERKLIKGGITPEMVEKEMKNAKLDLQRAEHTYDEEDYKWATVMAYYSMFHSIRALIYSKGYREKSHRALLIAFKELLIDSGILEEKYFKNFDYAMYLRESADYRGEYSEGSAAETIENAKDLLTVVEKILKR